MATWQRNSFLRNVTTSNALINPTSKMQFSCLRVQYLQYLDKFLKAGIFLQVGILKSF